MKIYLDLLPQDKKHELKRKKRARWILREEFLFTLPLLVLIVILANIYYILKIQHDSLISAQAQNITQEKFQQLSSLEEKFAQTNDLVANLAKIQDAHFYWHRLFTELDKVIPENVAINEVSTKNYQVFLTGKAKFRDNLLSFKDNLDSSECFKNAQIPLSDLVTKEDLDFQLDFTISKDCLMKNK